MKELHLPGPLLVCPALLLPTAPALAGGLSASLAAFTLLPSYPEFALPGLVAGLVVSVYFAWQAAALRRRLMENVIKPDEKPVENAESA